MKLDFQQILRRAGQLMSEKPPIKSGMVAVSVTANWKTGLDCVATVCGRTTFTYFIGWIDQKSVKPSPAKSNQIKPNQTKKMAWTAPAWFKARMERCNP
jgi:hypothetical protein